MTDKPNVHTDAPATLRAIAAPLLEMADRGAALVITCDTVAQMRSAAGTLEWAAQHIITGWPGWQPIETAPQDETTVQVWCKVSGWVPRAWFDPENPRRGWGYPSDDWCGSWTQVYPTHWMPLPAGPAGSPLQPKE